MIYIECKPDALLVKCTANIPKKEITHEFKGKGEVCNQLRKHRNCMGLVDEDPDSVQPRYISEAKLENELSETGLKVLYDNSNKNRIVVLCPTLEAWVLSAAKEAGLDVRKYSFPTDPVQLHKVINLDTPKLEEFLKDLAKSKSNRMKTLGKLLKESHNE